MQLRLLTLFSILLGSTLVLFLLLGHASATDSYITVKPNQTALEPAGGTYWTASPPIPAALANGSTNVRIAKNLGNFTIKPHAKDSTATAAPGAIPGGFGWAINYTMNGTIPPGSWSFSVKTHANATATGAIWVEVYKKCSGTATELFHVQSANVLTATTAVTTNISSVQAGSFAVAGCSLIVEYTLDVTVASSVAAANVTFISNITTTNEVHPNPVNNPPWHENVNGGTPNHNGSPVNPLDYVNFTSFWYDDIGLDMYMLEWNGSGSFVNTTPVKNFSASNSSWANVTVQIPAAAEGKAVYGRTWANDSYVNKTNATNNGTVVRSYMVVKINNVAPVVTLTAVNASVALRSTAICVNATATDVGVGVSQVWAEITYPNGTVQNRTMPDTGNVNCASVASDNIYGIAFDVGTTSGNLTVNRTWSNDTLNNFATQSPFPGLNVTVTIAPYHENVNGGTPSANTTTPNPGNAVNFTSFWYDDLGLSSYWLSWNTTGTFVNTTPVGIFSSTNQSWANVTVTIASSDEGKVLYGTTWANDSSGLTNHSFNGSTNFVVVIVKNVSPTITLTAVNTTSITVSNALCINATATDVGVGVSQVWAEITYPNGTIQNRTMPDTGNVNCASVASDNIYGIAIDVGTTSGTLTVNRTWANDTLNNVGRQTPDAALNVTVTSAATLSFTLLILASTNTTSNTTAPPGSNVSPSINFTYGGTEGDDANRPACNTAASPTCQDASNSIFTLFNTGSVSVNWSMSINTSMPSNIIVFCDSDSGPTGAVTLSTSFQNIATAIPASGNQNAWCWANFTLGAATGIQATLLQHNATQ